MEKKILKDAGINNQKSWQKKLTLIVEKTPTGFSAFLVDYPLFPTGQSIPKLIVYAYEATAFYFEEKKVKIGPENIRFQIDFKKFFKFYKVRNAKALAEKTGINATLLSPHISGSKKPSAKQTAKILTGINQIKQELSGLNLLQTA